MLHITTSAYYNVPLENETRVASANIEKSATTGLQHANSLTSHTDGKMAADASSDSKAKTLGIGNTKSTTSQAEGKLTQSKSGTKPEVERTRSVLEHSPKIGELPNSKTATQILI